MNLGSYTHQSNTQPGPFESRAGENLTGMEGRLVKLTHTGGVPEMKLPTSVDDKPDYLLLEGGAAGEPITVVALDRSGNCRVRLDGACNPGDELTLAAIAGVNIGKARTLPVAAGTYFVFLRAEEKGVDEQLVKVRPLLNARSVTVV